MTNKKYYTISEASHRLGVKEHVLRSLDHLLCKKLTVIRGRRYYKDGDIVAKLRSLAPFDYIMCAVADSAAVNAIGKIMQPAGGRFVHVRPWNESMNLPGNVELIYKSFSLTTQGPTNPCFSSWWYGEYLPMAMAGSIQPTPVEKFPGGLKGLDAGCKKLLAGVSSTKLVLDIWD